MDKYEFNIKLDEIQRYVAKRDYKSAADIAADMEWKKVKDWSVLSLVIEVFEKAGYYEDARDVAILAYNRNLGGRKLVYKLTEMFILLKEYDEADELYTEYERVARHDVNKFILLYKLRKAEGANTGELIGILEEYRDHELDEKYLFELAYLYAKSAKTDKCVKLCDQIVLWFQDGKYVEKAVKLKKKYAPLTVSQRKIYEAASKKETEEDLDATKELLFQKKKEKANIESDDIDAIINGEEDTNSYNIDVDKLSELDTATNVNEVQESDEAFEEPALENAQEEEAGPTVDLYHNEVDEKIVDAFKTLIAQAMDSTEKATEQVADTAATTASVASAIGTAPTQSGNSIEKAGQSLRELIEKANKRVESNVEQVKREAAEEELQEEVTANGVPVSDFNLYDTQNIQKELAKELGEILQEDEYSDIFKSSKAAPVEPVAVATGSEDTATVADDEQIEGQLSLADWMQSVKEEKYGKQNTKEFSKAELEKMLAERENEKEEYEKILAMQEELAKANGEVFDAVIAKQNADAQMAVIKAKTDLATRTGRASALLEVAAAQEMSLGDSQGSVEPQYDSAKDFVEEVKPEVKIEEPQVEEPVREDFTDRDYEEADDDYDEDDEEYEDDDEASEDNDNNDDEEGYEEEESIYKIPSVVAKFFKKYRDVPGLEKQLAELFAMTDKEVGMRTSSVGNIIISGNKTSDKTGLALNIVKALNTLYPANARKIAKTTGDSINHKGITKALPKLKGTVLIVEGAGAIVPKRIDEILTALDQETDGMLIIFEDEDKLMDVTVSVNQGIERKFNHRIVLKQFTVNELVEAARKYARKRQHDIDDNALLQLYLKIDKIHGQTDYVRFDQIKEIIDRAIIKAEKRASRKLFGSVKKRRGSNGDIIFLMESDFKD